MTTSRIEITPTMSIKVLKTTIVEKEASRATTKKNVLISKVHNMRRPLPWDH